MRDQRTLEINSKADKIIHKLNIAGLDKKEIGGCTIIYGRDTMYIFIDENVKELGMIITDKIYFYKNGNIQVYGGFEVEDVSSIFACCKLKTLDISNMYIPMCRNMEQMFCESTIEHLIGLNNLGVKNVTNLKSIFEDSEVNEIDISNWDTSNVTSVNKMFEGCHDIKINIGNINLSNVRDAYKMFCRVKNIDIDLSGLDTSHIMRFHRMFSRAKLKSLNIDNFNFSRARYLQAMFEDATIENLSTNFKPQKLNNLISAANMFEKCTIPIVNLGNLNFESNTGSQINVACMFKGSNINEIYMPYFGKTKLYEEDMTTGCKARIYYK